MINKLTHTARQGDVRNLKIRVITVRIVIILKQGIRIKRNRLTRLNRARICIGNGYWWLVWWHIGTNCNRRYGRIRRTVIVFNRVRQANVATSIIQVRCKRVLAINWATDRALGRRHCRDRKRTVRITVPVSKHGLVERPAAILRCRYCKRIINRYWSLVLVYVGYANVEGLIIVRTTVIGGTDNNFKRAVRLEVSRNTSF